MLSAILIFEAIIIYPYWRAKQDETYIPPAILKWLRQKTEITEDVYLPVSMIQAFFDLPEDERHLSPESLALQDLFMEKIGNEERKIAGISFDIQVSDPFSSGIFYYIFTYHNKTKDMPYISFRFVIHDVISKWQDLHYSFDYYPDGSLVRHAYIYSYWGIMYYVRNENNTETYLYKKYPDRTITIFESP